LIICWTGLPHWSWAKISLWWLIPMWCGKSTHWLGLILTVYLWISLTSSWVSNISGLVGTWLLLSITIVSESIWYCISDWRSISHWWHVSLWWVLNVSGANISRLTGNSSNSLTSLGIWITIVVVAYLFDSNIVSLFNLLVLDLILGLHGSNWVLLNSSLNLILHNCNRNFKFLFILSWFHCLYWYLINSWSFNSFINCHRYLFYSLDFFWFHNSDWYHLGVSHRSIFHLGNRNLLCPLVLLVLHGSNWYHFRPCLSSCFHICDGYLNSFIYFLTIHVSNRYLDLLGDWHCFHSCDWFVINSLDWVFIVVASLLLGDLVVNWPTSNSTWSILGKISIWKWTMSDGTWSVLSNISCIVGSWGILSCIAGILSIGDGSWSISLVVG